MPEKETGVLFNISFSFPFLKVGAIKKPRHKKCRDRRMLLRCHPAWRVRARSNAAFFNGEHLRRTYTEKNTFGLPSGVHSTAPRTPQSHRLRLSLEEKRAYYSPSTV